MKYGETLKQMMQASIDAKRDFLNGGEMLEKFQNAVTVVVKAYKNSGRLYIAGNGGSAADAQHIAAEFVSKLAKDRAPLPAEALTVDSSILTAIGNDYGYDQVFARQVEGKMRSGDVFLGITTSGKSKNIVNAITKCKEMSITTIVFCGGTGGDVKGMADYCIIANGEQTSTIQELHIVMGHALCLCVEQEMF